MKDFLKDLIEHTHGLGGIELIKITGTDKETLISAVADTKTVLVSGSFKTPIADFVGTFGMPNLSKLKIILGFEEYDDTSIISVNKTNATDPNQPTIIHFETNDKTFVNDYRLMSKAIVEEKVKVVTFRGAQWGVEFEPSVAGIRRLKKQAQANSEEEHFAMKSDGTDLKIYFGDPSTHSGNFVFQSGVIGNVTGKNFFWPVKEFIAIMDLVGDKIVRVSDAGVVEITVDSGIASYTYLLPANVK